MKSFFYTHKAQYYETDQMGIVHHSNYIRWFEEARVDFFEKIGCSYKTIEDMGIISPVLEVQAKYHSMVHFNDTVKIETSMESFNGIKLTMHYSITDAQTGELRTDGISRHCFMSKDGKLISLKRSYPDFYEKMMQQL